MKDLSSLRKNYEKASLDESLAQPNPNAQFANWLAEAMESGIAEPNAMTLATTSAQGRPSTRVVLIKGYDENGLTWFTNYNSRKGIELKANPYAALQFHWVELERVVRIEGPVSALSDQENDIYFHSRPLASRIGAWASPQSQAIHGRAQLLGAAAAYAAKFGVTPPRPPHWGGYRLQPDRWEFWQGRPSRLHDRVEYRLDTQGQWKIARLAP